jgi:O-succinylbenzoate synthase
VISVKSKPGTSRHDASSNSSDTATRFAALPSQGLPSTSAAISGENRHVPAPDPTLRVVAIPMRVRFRGIAVREAMLWRGPAGWAEFSPFWDYGPAECVPWWRAAEEAAHEGFPAPVRDSVPVNVTVPAVDAETAYALVADSGCRTAKVKVAERGQRESDDLARVEAVRDALGPGGAIRVDANAAWTVEDAADRLQRLDRAAQGLEYAEQPCRTVEDLAALRRRVTVPIAADESVRRAEDPLRVARLEAADVIVLKVAPLGGVRACLRLAEQCGLPVVVSSALETSVGLAAGVALAAALPELRYACGLGTARLLTGDVTDEPLLPVDGRLPVRPVAADEAGLHRWRAGTERDEAWASRLAAVRAAG